MFGHWMQIESRALKLRMGPIKRQDMTRYLAEDAGWGMQSYEVAKYLGRSPNAPTDKGEESWWERVSNDSEEMLWGVYIQSAGTWELIGSTSLRYMDAATHSRATSGYLCFDRKFWNSGVASLSHLARTMFAFDELGLLAIDSHAAAANIGSNKALRSVGYVQVGMHYGFPRPVHGRRLDGVDYLLVNPAENSWNYFWDRPASEIPSEFKKARKVTEDALQKARQSVRFM